MASCLRPIALYLGRRLSGVHFGEATATDFFTTGVWTPKGLVTYYTLFLLDLRTQRVRIAGSTPNPSEAFMTQVARNLTDAFDGFLLAHRFLICDRDSKVTHRFRRILRNAGVGTVIERARHRPTSGIEVRCTERLGGLLKHYRRTA